MHKKRCNLSSIKTQMKGEYSMTFLKTIFLVFGMFIFLSPYTVFAQTPIDAVDDTIFIPQNTTEVIIDVLANDLGDINQSSLTYTDPPKGTVIKNDDNTLTYKPDNSAQLGEDTFTYQICDTATSPSCETALVTIYVAKPVAVDIKPGSCPNPINVKSRGVLPAAILGSEEFNVTTIDAASLRLQGVAPIRSSKEDVATPFTGEITSCEDCTELGPDGYIDLTLKFSTQEIFAALGEVIDEECIVLQLTGFADNGDTPIIGRDVVRILKKGKVKTPKQPNPHKPIKN
jgi:hypothetical protein